MVQPLLDFLKFISVNFGFLTSLILYTVLAIAFSKQIKKYANVLYWFFGLISFSFLFPFILGLCGVNVPFDVIRVPLLGLAIEELSHAAFFIHPVLVIIMYMGAFSAKHPYVGRLMSIRKELSIIVGFPVLAHAIKRIFLTFPNGWSYFFHNEEFMQRPMVSSALGSGITSFAYMLGIVMSVLFLILWVTSFDSVHKKMGGKRWKKLQKGAYGLYAMLFLHSICIQLGFMVTFNARLAQQGPAEIAEAANQVGAFVLSDIAISPATIRIYRIAIVIVVYASYLYFKLRKIRRNKENKLKFAHLKK